MPTKAQLQDQLTRLQAQLDAPLVQAALAGDWETVRSEMLKAAAAAPTVQDVQAILNALRKKDG